MRGIRCTQHYANSYVNPTVVYKCQFRHQSREEALPNRYSYVTKNKRRNVDETAETVTAVPSPNNNSNQSAKRTSKRGGGRSKSVSAKNRKKRINNIMFNTILASTVAMASTMRSESR